MDNINITLTPDQRDDVVGALQERAEMFDELAEDSDDLLQRGDAITAAANARSLVTRQVRLALGHTK